MSVQVGDSSGSTKPPGAGDRVDRGEGSGSSPRGGSGSGRTEPNEVRPSASAAEPTPTEPFAAVERELHAIAAGLLRGERRDHTLQPTALMHEAWLRLARVQTPWEDQGHFVRAAAGTMRRVLVEHGRARARAKRGGGGERLTLATDIHGAAAPPADVLAIDDALQRLATVDQDLVQIAELRVFGGLSHPEIARATGSSLRSVERGWRLARAFLRRELEGGDAG
jgi:RNA polymerase sigma factor (TIGR02999 family)